MCMWLWWSRLEEARAWSQCWWRTSGRRWISPAASGRCSSITRRAPPWWRSSSRTPTTPASPLPLPPLSLPIYHQWYILSYESTISGYISKGRLASLSGVSVKLFFFWVNIVEVTRNGGELGFSVGIASASFPLDNFFVSPQCGCGLLCDNLQARKLKLDPSVYSV